MLVAAATEARAGREMLAAAAAEVEGGVGNTVVGKSRAGVGKRITREKVVAKQLLMVNPSCLIMVGSCCYTTTIIGAWP
jgi:hypothetical protein